MDVALTENANKLAEENIECWQKLFLNGGSEKESPSSDAMVNNITSNISYNEPYKKRSKQIS